MPREISTFEARLDLAPETLRRAVMLHNDDLEEGMRRGVEEALRNLDVAAIARQRAEPIIREALEDAIRRYFRSGEGADAFAAFVNEQIAAAVTQLAADLRKA